jgi:hypothetical protein
MAVQRVLRESITPVQRTADVTTPPVREIRPVAAVEANRAPTHSMMAAPQPDDRRLLGVVEEPAVDSVAPQLSSSPEYGTVDDFLGSVSHQPDSSVSHATPSIDPGQPTVQCLPSTTDSLPPAPQVISTTSTSTAITSEPRPLLRHLPMVQRAVTEGIGSPEGVGAARPVPVLQPIESPGGRQPHRQPNAMTPAGNGGTSVQRSTDLHSTHRVTSDAATPSATTPPLSSTEPASTSQLPVITAVDTHHIATTPPLPTVQRVSTTRGEITPKSAATTPVGNGGTPVQRTADHGAADFSATDTATPADPLPSPTQPVSAGRVPVTSTVDAHTVATTPPSVSAQRTPTIAAAHQPAPRAIHDPRPDAVASSRATVEIQRLPVVEAQVANTVASPKPKDLGPKLPTAQRSPEGHTDARVDTHIHAAETPIVSEGREQLTPLAQQNEAVPVQNQAVPVLNTMSSHSDSSPNTVVQRAATGGRLVVLPPVRTSSSANDVASDTLSAPTSSVLSDSPRPVGLQRMFEHSINFDDGASDRESTSSTSAGHSSAALRRGSYITESGSGAPQVGTCAASHDSSTNTITFSSPTVQREPEVGSSSSESAPAAPAPAVAMTSAAAPAAAGAAPGHDIDELVNRLYDPLAARLRTELWQDRERAGVLMDLGR